MRKFVKVASALSLSLCLMSVSTVSTMAVTTDELIYNEVMPALNYISKHTASLYISGSSATITVRVTGTYGTTTKTRISATLQRKSGSSWVNVKSWSESSNSYQTSLSESYSVSSNHTYRVKAVCKAYQHGSWESTTVYSNKIST